MQVFHISPFINTFNYAFPQYLIQFIPLIIQQIYNLWGDSCKRLKVSLKQRNRIHICEAGIKK